MSVRDSLVGMCHQKMHIIHQWNRRTFRKLVITFQNEILSYFCWIVLIKIVFTIRCYSNKFWPVSYEVQTIFRVHFQLYDIFEMVSFDTGALTHWGRVTHICVNKFTINGSDNGLSHGWRQAIIWTNAGILLIRTLGTNFSEILTEIHAFSFKKMHLKMSSAKWRPFVSASMC